jgi:sulfide:quinone oxidoreductase
LALAAADDPLRVLIAGAGVAAFEAALALRDLAGERVSLAFLAPDREFRYRPLAVVEPFGLGRSPRFALEGLVAGCSARRHRGRLAEVDVQSRRARTDRGSWIEFEALVVAVGARPRPAVKGTISYVGHHDALTHRRLLNRLTQRQEGTLVFAVPDGPSWPLPLYELALLTAAELRTNGLSTVKLVLVTPEASPLSIFGAQASQTVADLLVERGIEIISGHTVESVDGQLVTLRPASELRADRVVALAQLEGPRIAGLPASRDGFVPVDPHGRVPRAAGVFAAGDATTFPVKHGGLASQQADAAAETIAAHAGVQVTPSPFKPVLHGLVLTGESPIFLRVALTGGHGETSQSTAEELWWPPSKIVGRHLAPYLATHPELQLE